jgi:hypothetical protein
MDFCEDAIETSGYIEGEDFLTRLSDYQLLRQYPILWRYLVMQL